MAFLLDLPDEMRAKLAARWGVEAGEDDPAPPGSSGTAGLFRAMTDPERVRAQLDALPAGAGDLLARLADSEPVSAAELLARVPVGAGAFGTALAALGELGLVLRAPVAEAGHPRPANPPFGAEPLYVAPEIAATLAVRRAPGRRRSRRG